MRFIGKIETAGLAIYNATPWIFTLGRQQGVAISHIMIAHRERHLQRETFFID